MQRIAQCLIWYLPPTMGYIHDHIMGLGPERSVVFAMNEVEADRFPFDPVYIAELPSCPPRRRGRALAVTLPSNLLWGPLVRKEGVGLLHIHDGRLAPSFLPLARYCRLPMVTTFLGFDASASPRTPGYTEALQPVFEEGALFTVMSLQMAQQIKRLGCPEEKIRVIHHGIPLRRFPFIPRGVPDRGPKIVLTAGRLIPKKGLDDLARAFAAVCRRRSDVILRVAGEGEMQPELEAILREEGIGERVELLGRLETEELAHEMLRANLFCLPCRVGPNGDSEGIPNTLKEAMATGLPVVSTYHSGIPELVEDDVSGYLVPERDVGAIADRLVRLLDEPERWEAMGRAGRAKVEAEFALDSAVRQLEAEVYAPLLRGLGQT